MGIRVLLLVVALIVLCIYAQEGFADKPAKAKAIYDWFRQNPVPSYSQFRRDMGGKSNIVEYEDILRRREGLTLETVMSAI